VNFSADYHKAKEIGQMSMFGASTGMSDNLALPDVQEVAQREMLKWEKDLLGLYISGRPADKYKDALQYAGTVDVAELKASGGATMKQAKVAGEVVGLRKMVTKNGQMMAVAHIEDWHETGEAIDVVFFPRTWEKFQDVIKEGVVISASGKVDNSRSEMQIIGDFVSQNLSSLAPEQSIPLSMEPPSWAGEGFYEEEIGESLPPPSYFPEPESVAVVAPATQGAVAVRMPAVVPQLVAEPRSAPIEVNWNQSDDLADLDLALANEKPVPPERWMLIYLQRSDDADQDRRRLRRIHGLLTQYPGKDRFTIVIEDRKSAFKMEFPNDTTDYCEDLVKDLLTVVGEERNIEVFDRPH
jgi:hypothetical protein